MSTDFEHRLRADMERRTASVHLRPGLAHRAYLRHRRQRITTRAIVAVGTAAVVAGTAVAVAGITAPAGPGGGPRVQTVAYVIQRMEKALGAAGQAGTISHTQTSFPAGAAITPYSDTRTSSYPLRATPLPVGSLEGWAYGGRFRSLALSAAGKPLWGETLTETATTQVNVAVDYGKATWWRAVAPAATIINPDDLASGGCTGVTAAGPLTIWPALIRHELACGNYTITGRAWVNGVDAITIRSAGQGSPGIETLYVDPATYLPLRIVTVPRSSAVRPTIRTDFTWLPATSANVADLNPPIPSGFTQVSPPKP